MMLIRCPWCGWSFTLGREALTNAVAVALAANDLHHIENCPRCRKVIKIQTADMKRRLPPGTVFDLPPAPPPAEAAAPAPAPQPAPRTGVQLNAPTPPAPPPAEAPKPKAEEKTTTAAKAKAKAPAAKAKTKTATKTKTAVAKKTAKPAAKKK